MENCSWWSFSCSSSSAAVCQTSILLEMALWKILRKLHWTIPWHEKLPHSSRGCEKNIHVQTGRSYQVVCAPMNGHWKDRSNFIMMIFFFFEMCMPCLHSLFPIPPLLKAPSGRFGDAWIPQWGVACTQGRAAGWPYVDCWNKRIFRFDWLRYM